MRTLYKHITECHTQTNNRHTNQRDHCINILPNVTHKQITVIPINENIKKTYYRMPHTNK